VDYGDSLENCYPKGSGVRIPLPPPRRTSGLTKTYVSDEIETPALRGVDFVSRAGDSPK
jgi:hypothetical protein